MPDASRCGGCGLRLRPTLRFDADARRTVGRLAGVGVVTVAAQQLVAAVAVRLANDSRHQISVYTFTLAQTVYLVPWSVLAVPVATSVYPALATAAYADRRRADVTAGRWPPRPAPCCCCPRSARPR